MPATDGARRAVSDSRCVVRKHKYENSDAADPRSSAPDKREMGIEDVSTRREAFRFAVHRLRRHRVADFEACER